MDGQHLSRPLHQQGISQAEDPRRVGHLCLWIHPLAYTPGSQMASQWGPLSTELGVYFFVQSGLEKYTLFSVICV